MKLLLFGVAVHAVFLYSVFDIYFTSPISHGATPVSIRRKAAARRLVLFVADGLRADKFYELDKHSRPRAPYLRSVIEKEGAWGVSHTKVPTESRPGHVALIAGMFEDVSAIARGWKENPVEFDSVFNQSTYTWSWGSPDILPMFAKGASGDHVFTEMYSAADQEFTGSESYKLDTWVFNKVEQFFENAKWNVTLRTMLQSDKVILFLHLLGLDTNGHSHKPMSLEYLENIQVVDKGISECVKLVNKFFGSDKNTAFIMTSDHGMTDWGSHGSGDPEETLTPFVAWGAGIRQPASPGESDRYSDKRDFDWSLSHLKRVDLNQVDVAPLISSLLGINFPTNSMGILPFDYLLYDWQYRAEAMLTNIKQLLAQYHLKQELRKRSTLFFRPFTELSAEKENAKIATIVNLFDAGRYEESVFFLYRLILLTQKGIEYYNRYDRFILKFVITLAFISWMLYLIILILEDHTGVSENPLDGRRSKSSEEPTKHNMRNAVLFILISAVCLILFIQSSPIQYYAYFTLPVILWYLVFTRKSVFHKGQLYARKHNMEFQIIKLVTCLFFALEILVMTFFHRVLLSVGFIMISYGSFSSNIFLYKQMKTLTWRVICIVMAIFPMLPTVGKISNYTLVAGSGWLLSLVIAYCARRPELQILRSGGRESLRVTIAMITQIFVMFLSAFIVSSTSKYMSTESPIPIFIHIFSWSILASTFILTLLGSSYVATRLLNIYTSLAAVYLLLSSSYEPLFILCLGCLLFLWFKVEYNYSTSNKKIFDIQFTRTAHEEMKRAGERTLTAQDFHRAYIFIYLITASFFGTGNIASLNSFQVSSVFCFITVFNPFIMGSLLLLKVIIPFIMVTCIFRSIHIALNVPTRGLLLVVLFMSDFMGLHFFFLVQDTGSWLDIGTSISHYVIVMLTIIFVMVLYGVATLLTSFNLSYTNKKFKLHWL